MMNHQQGEHVFNALGDLALELEPVIRGRINAAAPAEVRGAATAAADDLHTLAIQFNTARNNATYRTGTKGDPRNPTRYSDLSQGTRTAVRQIVSGEPSAQTAGYTTMNRLYDSLKENAVDKVAQDSAREALAQNLRAGFDAWFQGTLDLLFRTYAAIRDAALAAARTWT